MALATQCPHCQTTFRVAHDQLKLRAGLVRCGACKQIFNGIEHLLRPGVTALPGTAPPPALLQPAQESVPAPVPARPADSDDFYPAFDPIIAPADALVTSDPMQRMTLMRLAYDDEDDHADTVRLPAADEHFVVPLKAKSRQDNDEPALDELAQTIAQLQQRPWRSNKATSTAGEPDDEPAYDVMPDEPSFVTRGRRRQLLGRSRRLWLIALVVLLALAALGQTVYVLRDQIAARVPATKPWLIKACTLWDCRIALLAQASQVSIESSELITLNPAANTFTLNLLLRNSSPLPQRWPALELTLLDGSGAPVSRRVFTAVDYLPQAPAADSGFAAASEQSARITFELLQQKASNYRVYLFYP
ncbi:DUF3426 domain-containing protein [Actimicrobium sp. CCC2.4]|uniref:DUF3426 domain-containing protein n=1 Tax=Actimicrobium sp. CCC2.4 TaxID=3048606 RepID=UPI002AC9D0BD|nr:DUF3426 domain-containing protein [Actimicrobium sp. CCC2.4]MEB0134497.1 DUF3426 domain-containing protein [Actimicrobium sp. CCC2.4]WPX33128.1 DUF3426 domain-containing protein [Actimicrobium sp. CCC2.4]